MIISCTLVDDTPTPERRKGPLQLIAMERCQFNGVHEKEAASKQPRLNYMGLQLRSGSFLAHTVEPAPFQRDEFN